MMKIPTSMHQELFQQKLAVTDIQGLTRLLASRGRLMQEVLMRILDPHPQFSRLQ